MSLPVIGVIGGIGSGKSLVAQALAEFGGQVINADQLGHEALRQPEMIKKVVHRWGPAIQKPNGDIDRRQLGRIVFAEEQERQALEALVFPYIERRIREEIALAQQHERVRFVVLDAAIMLETGWHEVCDKIVFVDAPQEVRYQRVTERSGWSAREVQQREQAQLPLDEKRRRAHAVVTNAGAPDEVPPQLESLLRQWHYL